MSTAVVAGQVWSILDYVGNRYEFRIERVDPPGPFANAHGVTVRGGKKATMRISTLETHRRGARLVADANGRPVSPHQPQSYGVANVRTAEYQRSAGDYRRVTKPRGMPPPLRDCELQAWSLVHDQGLSCAAIGRQLGVPAGRVRSWVEKVRIAREEQRLQGAAS